MHEQISGDLPNVVQEREVELDIHRVVVDRSTIRRIVRRNRRVVALLVGRIEVGDLHVAIDVHTVGECGPQTLVDFARRAKSRTRARTYLKNKKNKLN